MMTKRRKPSSLLSLKLSLFGGAKDLSNGDKTVLNEVTRTPTLERSSTPPFLFKIELIRKSLKISRKKRYFLKSMSITFSLTTTIFTKLTKRTKQFLHSQTRILLVSSLQIIISCIHFLIRGLKKILVVASDFMMSGTVYKRDRI